MRTKQLAKYLRLHPDALRVSMKSGDYQDIPCIKINERGDRRFDKNEVLAYLERKFN